MQSTTTCQGCREAPDYGYTFYEFTAYQGRHGYPGADCRVQDDIRRERQMDGIAKAKDRGVKFGRKPELTPERIAHIRKLRKAATTVPDIMRQMKLSKASVYRALGK